MAQAELGINIVARNQAKGALAGLKREITGIQTSLGSVMKIAAGNFISSAAIGSVKALSASVKGVVGAFGEAAMAASDFNAQISSIGAVSGASAQQLGQLKQLALDLGVDPNLKVSATEAASAIEMLARNGLKVPQIMDGAAKATILLANATGAEFATAADIGTDAMALFGIQANEMMTAVDGIVSVTNNSKFSINDYALALAQGGGVAATVGVSFDDFNTSIAAMAPLFKSGSDAGTSFKTFLQRLVPQTDGAATAMMDLGLMTKDGQNAFFDASGQLKDMAEITGILNKATRDLTEEQKIHYLSTIFGSDAMRAAAGIAKFTEQDYRNLQATMGDTSAIEGARKRMDNLAGDMEIFRSVVESVRIQVGDEFQPALRSLFQAATSTLSNLAPIIVDFSGRIAAGISGSIDDIQGYKAEFDKTIASFGDNKLGGILAGLGQATGGTLTVDAEAQIVSVDWLTGILGETSFVYDATSQVLSVDWTGGWLTGVATGYTYDVNAKVLTVDWLSDSGNQNLFVYDAEAGITKVNWDNEYGWTYTYDASAGVTEVDFGVFNGKYSGTVDISEVLWGVYFHRYEATAGITDVAWGAYTHTYQPDAEVTKVLWGVWTYTYSTEAAVNSVLWGAFTNTYTSTAQIKSVAWGAYSHTYDSWTKIGEDKVLWGLWSHTYDSQTSITSVLWGMFTNTYDAKAGIGENDVLWGAWTWTYGANAEITSVLWGAFTNTYEAIANIKWPTPPGWVNWLMGWDGNNAAPANVPNRTSSRVSGSAKPKENANGTDFFEGGWTWVGEKGPELLNLPRGARILSNTDSKKMIGQMAEGTGLPTNGGLFDGLAKTLGFAFSVFDNAISEQASKTDALSQTVTDNTEAVNTATNATAESIAATQKTAGTLATTGELIRVSAEQFAAAAGQSGSYVMDGVAHFSQSFMDLLDSFGDNLDSALQSVPGLFGASQVTGDQMRMAELGIPQNFADDWLRRLTDEVVNGVDWEGVDIKDAAMRAGIDPNLPAEAILELVTQKWNDRSFFADKANLDLFNMEAVQAELMRQQASAAGTANIMELFGITPEAATQAGVTAGGTVRDAMMGQLRAGTGVADVATTLAASVAENVTPESFAAVGPVIVTSISDELAKPEYSKQIFEAIAKVFSGASDYKDQFVDVSRDILTQVANGFASVEGIDMAGKLAASMRTNLALEASVQTLKDIGARILEYVFRGYEAAAKDKDWAYATVGSAGNGGNSDTATTTGNALGTRNWRGGVTWVGETGPELVALPAGSRIFSNSESMAMAGAGGSINVTVNVASVANSVDIEALAYRVAQAIQRRR